MAAAAAIIRSIVVLLFAFSAFFLASGVQTGRHAKASPAAAAGNGDGDGKKVYIVFTERQPAASEMSKLDVGATIKSFHHSLLSDALGGTSSSSAPERVLYHYTRSLHGFAARLTKQEKNNLAGKDGVLSIHERVVYRQQTTRSWNFLGLPLHEHRSLPLEQNVIVGMIDGGISAESPSFSDDGLAPPPARWKGRCSEFFKCNNKIIGAWAYSGGSPDGEVTPEDNEGHGTHTASTAAGRAVRNASLYGVASGTARGGVPGARLAIYKACWEEDGCASEDILAAMDDAIADGVDVISASISGPSAKEYSDDALAIGAFHAMRRGVVTSVAAGNCGPKLGTVTNVAPWMISTAATTTDRKIVSKVVLGNGKHFLGSSINTFPDMVKRALILDPGNWQDLEGARYKGAILLCPLPKFLIEHQLVMTGAAGVILPQDDDSDSQSYSFPAAVVRPAQFQEILEYYNSSRDPVISIWNSQTVLDAEAPDVAGFSSRGPNLITPGILKPDISAPGVNILAAWSNQSTVTMEPDDDRGVPYNIISGTSMACPHVTGAAAYVKSVHPDWSPAAIISSLVTTAKPIHSTMSEAEFAYGAGQVNSAGAVDPGLVYDASEADYADFLCAQGYNTTQMATVTGTNATCSSPTSSVADLNYPSIAVPVLNYGVSFSETISRTVTNVGRAGSVVYRAKISSMPGITVSVEPDELAFRAGQKRRSFKVTVSGMLSPGVSGRLGASASVVWSDGKHEVRSPIYVFPQQMRSYTSTESCRCKMYCDLVE
ncbi:hypothetical protein ACP70R_022733 [Stipagrostis hirtigluma subsp. patula]